MPASAGAAVSHSPPTAGKYPVAAGTAVVGAAVVGAAVVDAAVVGAAVVGSVVLGSVVVAAGGVVEPSLPDRSLRQAARPPTAMVAPAARRVRREYVVGSVMNGS
jgi:hypothetical protein